MAAESTLLKVLLRQRHMQGYTTFRKEYDRVAKQLDSDLIGKWPSKAQFYRWMSGDLQGLPYADHCRILEKMFPGWSAQQLLEPHDGDGDGLVTAPQREAAPTHPAPRPVQLPQQTRLADLTAVYPTRTEFLHNVTPRTLFDGAQEIYMAGLSLNMFCQQYSDRSILDAIEQGTVIKALFLDPSGTYTAAREREEGLPDGHLSTLTRLNIEAIRRVGSKVSASAAGSLGIRVYDEPLRFNITIIDQRKCIVQSYLPDARGVESPTMVIERNETMPGLYTTFAQVFDSMWDRAQEVA